MQHLNHNARSTTSELLCIHPLAVVPEYQSKGYAARLMEEAKKQLDADVIFIMGNRYNTLHNMFPIKNT
ncbi:hypothetical protein VCHA56P521_50068 [Vibrio chagasii]|nr:hypothetical protein VCHA36P168_50254 [Vibrio chagasii]CAH7266856.1 hypothetical protein VCHA43P282_40067 [Vibrio chagasii]CAH7369851.1 hypothetical protein VCHA52P461_50257 [Vibrio chagasii]CAH7425300.1 hypothetical protein VCHA38O210_30068 [Vibrio chagasii]CAH7447691.1 hypothetical protein VCHA37P203_50068 [Vibrio chagasii]